MFLTDLRSLSLVATLCLAVPALAADNDDWALTPEDTWQLLQDQGDSTLFIDVRDPVEIQFTGFVDAVDAVIPFRLVDREQWNEEKNHFAMPLNPDMATLVAQALADKGLDRDARIITMCRSGSARGKPSAEFLRDQGFANSFYIDHGFQGDTADSGDLAGRRVVNGWQNSGLPWSDRMDKDKLTSN